MSNKEKWVQDEIKLVEITQISAKSANLPYDNYQSSWSIFFSHVTQNIADITLKITTYDMYLNKLRQFKVKVMTIKHTRFTLGKQICLQNKIYLNYYSSVVSFPRIKPKTPISWCLNALVPPILLPEGRRKTPKYILVFQITRMKVSNFKQLQALQNNTC